MTAIGIDLVEIGRIRKSLQNRRFFHRVFGPLEQQELLGKRNPLSSAAACFAAKEAFSKALGTGIRGFSLEEVQLLHDPLGKPYLQLNGNAAALAREKQLVFCISITHTKEYAAAVVAADREGCI